MLEKLLDAESLLASKIHTFPQGVLSKVLLLVLAHFWLNFGRPGRPFFWLAFGSLLALFGSRFAPFWFRFEYIGTIFSDHVFLHPTSQNTCR